MPSTYAHYKFGEQLRRQLSGHAAGVVEEHLLFIISACTGRNLLFYYKPLVNNPVSTLASECITNPLRFLWQCSTYNPGYFGNTLR